MPKPKRRATPAPLVQSHRVRQYSPFMQRLASRATVQSNPGLVDPTGALMLTNVPSNTIYTGTRPYTDDNFAHEIGHLADNGRSSWPFFRLLLEANARLPINDPSAEFLRTFPGIGNTPMTTWGGPTEAFAEIMARSGGDLKNVPFLLRPFFAKYTRPQQ